jgi:hypothetical protein
MKYIDRDYTAAAGRLHPMGFEKLYARPSV